MKIKFLKNVTVDITTDDANDLYDRLYHRNDIIECDIVPISKGFSALHLPNNEYVVDVKNDCFEKLLV